MRTVTLDRARYDLLLSKGDYRKAVTELRRDLKMDADVTTE